MQTSEDYYRESERLVAEADKCLWEGYHSQMKGMALCCSGKDNHTLPGEPYSEGVKLQLEGNRLTAKGYRLKALAPGFAQEGDKLYKEEFRRAR